VHKPADQRHRHGHDQSGGLQEVRGEAGAENVESNQDHECTTQPAADAVRKDQCAARGEAVPWIPLPRHKKLKIAMARPAAAPTSRMWTPMLDRERGRIPAIVYSRIQFTAWNASQ